MNEATTRMPIPTEMPQYQSHKVVRALKIGAIEIHKSGTATVAPKDPALDAFGVHRDWVIRFHGDDDNLGYYVVYADGFVSWSPDKAFEEGYTLIGDGGAVPQQMQTSILQPWVMQLPRRYQGVLLGAVRGCDSVEKHDPSKALIRVLRGCFLETHCAMSIIPCSFIERQGDLGYKEVRVRMDAFLGSNDHYPQHFVAHVMHAAEVIGYKHPVADVRIQWGGFYEDICIGLHVKPETQTALDDRLCASEKEFKEAIR